MRFKQAREIDFFATTLLEKYPGSIIILNGDFNAVPESSTVRFLKGLDFDTNYYSTMWTDCYEACNPMEKGFTVNLKSPYAKRTASLVGITRPDLIPERKVDYVFVKGFAYGRPGSPVESYLLDVDSPYGYASDHYGVYAKLIVT